MTRSRKSFIRTFSVFAALGSFIMMSLRIKGPGEPYTLNYPANFGNRISIPEENPITKEGVELGRRLFYEKRLSVNRNISCGSCHEQRYAFADSRRFSVGTDGKRTDRNSMSLCNLLWANRFFWDGRVSGLEQQAPVPMANPHEMGQSPEASSKKLAGLKPYPDLFEKAFGDRTVSAVRIVYAIAQFERTLISAGSAYDRYLAGTYAPTAEELKGMALFNDFPQPGKLRGANCARCHGGVKTYLELFHNNGLDSLPRDAGIGSLTKLAGDRGRFKVPGLRNIALTAPYMHDGRFGTLEQVLDHYSDHVSSSDALSPVLRGASNDAQGNQLHLFAEEKKQIIAFLNMLTDTAFITDPRFSDPGRRPLRSSSNRRK